MKIATIPNAESITNVIICTLWNAVICFVFCALIQVSLIVTAYIWQGLVIAVVTFYVILPMILQNLAFLLQLLFKVDLLDLRYSSGLSMEDSAEHFYIH